MIRTPLSSVNVLLQRHRTITTNKIASSRTNDCIRRLKMNKRERATIVTISSSSSSSSSRTVSVKNDYYHDDDDDDDELVRINSRSRGSRVIARASSNTTTPSEQKSMVVIPGDYRIGGTLIAVAILNGFVFHLWTQFVVHFILGSFLTLQASRVRFRFSDDALDVVFIEPFADDSEALKVVEAQENRLQEGGGQSKWSFDSVTNWEFWFPGFPVLVYYKENQTKIDGQPHFFPIIMDGKKLYEQMLQKMPKSLNEKPLVDEWNLLTAFKSTGVGRSLIEKMSEEQIKQAEETTGLPFLDDKK